MLVSVENVLLIVIIDFCFYRGQQLAEEIGGPLAVLWFDANVIAIVTIGTFGTDEKTLDARCW